MKQTHLWITDIDPCIYTWPALYLGHKIRTLYRHLSKHLSKHLSSYIIDRSGGVPSCKQAMALTLYRCLNKKTTKKKFHYFGMKLLFHKSLNFKLSSERLNTHALFL